MRLFDNYPVMESVIVNTRTEAFRGLLWACRNGWLVLRQAELSKGRGEWTPVDGEVAVDRGRVEFVQVLVRGIQT